MPQLFVSIFFAKLIDPIGQTINWFNAQLIDPIGNIRWTNEQQMYPINTVNWINKHVNLDCDSHLIDS